MSQHDNRADRQEQLCGALGISQSVKRKQIVQDEKGRDFQNDLPHYCKTQGIFSQAQSLEYAYGEEIYAKEDQSQAESLKEFFPISYDSVIIHKQADQCAGAEVVQEHDHSQDGNHQLQGKENGIFHTSAVSRGKIVAYQGHDALGKSQGDLHGNHVDLVSDPHGRHGVCAVNSSKIIQDRHTGYIEKILDRSRYSNAAYFPDDPFLKRKFPGINTYKSLSSFHIEKDKKVYTSGTVGKKGGKARSCRSHVEAPGKDENRVKDNIQEAAAHSADTCMHGGPFGADKVSHDHVEYGGSGTQENCPEEIALGSCPGSLIGSDKGEKRTLEQSAEKSEQDSAHKGAVKAKGRAAGHSIVVLPAQSAAHHTGGSHAEQIVDGIKGKENRG